MYKICLGVPARKTYLQNNFPDWWTHSNLTAGRESGTAVDMVNLTPHSLKGTCQVTQDFWSINSTSPYKKHFSNSRKRRVVRKEKKRVLPSPPQTKKKGKKIKIFTSQKTQKTHNIHNNIRSKKTLKKKHLIQRGLGKHWFLPKKSMGFFTKDHYLLKPPWTLTANGPA